jgi:O-antigen ligase
MLKSEKVALSRWVLLTSGLTTIAISPWWTYDPINVPKMSILFFFAFPIGLLIFKVFVNSIKQRDFASLMAAGFLLSLGLAFTLSNEDKIQQIYGAPGRNTGLITLVAFLLIFLGLLNSVTENFSRDFTLIFVAVGLISAVYGLIQTLGLDPADWVNPYSPVIGFLGNPNFQSSFIGMSFVFLLSIILDKKLGRKKRFLGIFVQILFLINIFETKSQQGLIIVVIGSSWVIYNKIRNSKFSKLGLPYCIFVLVCGAMGALGALRIGPLSKFIYTDSITYRGDYWRAGMKMWAENPFFGVGIDAYGSWYARARDLKATLRRGGNVVSNAAHNVYIDMASNGGLFLFLSYVFINILVFFAIFKTVRALKSFDPFFIALSGAWFSFQAQSIISINQIGLSVWGWAISGSILGYSRFLLVDSDQSSRPVKSKVLQKPSMKSSKTSPHYIMKLIAGLMIGGSVALPPIIAETKYMSLIQSGDAAKIFESAYLEPNTPYRMFRVATAFQENNIQDQALKIGLDGSLKYPDFLDGWKFLYQSPASSTELKARALAEIRRLDPLNPEFK